MSTNLNLKRTTAITLLTLGIGTTVLAPARAQAENSDACGWMAWAIAAGLVAGAGFFVPERLGGQVIVGVFTMTTAGYLAMDYLKIPCLPPTQIVPCDDSLGGCDTSPEPEQPEPGQPIGGDDGSES